MIDDNDDRIDLTPINAPTDAAQAERVVSRAMARIATLGAPRAPMLAGVAQWWYPGLAAAALIGVAAGATVVFTSPTHEPAPPIEAQVVDWARSGHVPNNGDILAAFSGLSR